MTLATTTPACPGSRTAAWLIDAAISIGLIALSMFVGAGTWNIEEFVLQTSYAQLGVIALLVTMSQVLCMSLFACTAGMALCELVITKPDGSKPSPLNYVRRPLGLVLIIGTVGVIVVLPLFMDSRSTIGDLISGTRVIEQPAPGRKVAYQAWRVFRLILKPVGVLSFVVCLAAFLIYQEKDANKDIVLDAVLVASMFSLLVSSIIAVLKVRFSRVRLTQDGIQRAGIFGWSSNVINWDEIDHSRIVARRHFPYFEIHRRNRRRFRVPMETDLVTLTVQALMANGIRIEQ